MLLRQAQLLSNTFKIRWLHGVTNGYTPMNPLSSSFNGLLIMKQKTLSGVESVHNQVRDTAAGWAIQRIDPANDNGHLVFVVSPGFNP